MIDSLAEMQCNFEGYGIQRICSVYFNRTGEMAWTKAWFNGSDTGEPAQPIRLSVAAAFIRGDITKDQMLSRYFPKPMQACREVESEIQKEMLGY